MARNRSPPTKPRRRTYQTGGVLPELGTEFRPVPLGHDENGDPDGQVRALAVLIRNRDNSRAYIREGHDSDDEVEIAPNEEYRIWEPNGVNYITLRGENGGETLEIRALEAHNDFAFTDKIDAFMRSISHYVGTATRDTNITGQDVELNIDDSANIDVDVTAQTVGDVKTFNREGYTRSRFVRGLGFQGTETHPWLLYDSADFDGSVESVTCRAFAQSQDDRTNALDAIGASIQIDRHDGQGWRTISPQRAHSTYLAARLGGGDIHVGHYSSERECMYTYEPKPGLYFEEGDDVRVIVTDDATAGADDFSPDYNVEVNVEINERVRQ